MAYRLLVLVPHEHMHAPRSILEQARKLGPDVTEMRAIKHTMELIAHSLCIANVALDYELQGINIGFISVFVFVKLCTVCRPTSPLAALFACLDRCKHPFRLIKVVHKSI